jgi:hypothetical protein
VSPERQYPRRPGCAEPILVQSRFRNGCPSGLAEFKRVTKVRILLAPPISLECREIAPGFHRNTRIIPVFRDCCRETGLQRTDRPGSRAIFVRVFSGRHTGGQVSRREIGECNAITSLGSGHIGLTLVDVLLPEPFPIANLEDENGALGVACGIIPAFLTLTILPAFEWSIATLFQQLRRQMSSFFEAAQCLKTPCLIGGGLVQCSCATAVGPRRAWR